MDSQATERFNCAELMHKYEKLERKRPASERVVGLEIRWEMSTEMAEKCYSTEEESHNRNPL